MCLCVHAESLQLCLTLRYHIDCSYPGSSVHGILQARWLAGFSLSQIEYLPPEANTSPSPRIICNCRVRNCNCKSKDTLFRMSFP